MTRHSHEDALTASEFEDLLTATERIKDRFEVECRFLLIAAGRLGLRAGEITHLSEDWIDWDESMIRIPRHDPCTNGRNGGICGYCRDRAAEAAEHDASLSIQDARARRWEPKTTNSARAIPFDFDDRVQDVVEEFFFDHEAWPGSRSSINRRVDRVLETAGYSREKAYPHSLRASAATYHSFAGVPPAALQSLFGWSQLQVAQKYIRLSGGATQDALVSTHRDG